MMFLKKNKIKSPCQTESIIQEVPTSGVLDKPGQYILRRDFISKDINAIRIEAENVSLNLNQNVIINNADTNMFTCGINAVNSVNFRVFNGCITGASVAIQAPYSTNLNINLISISHCSRIGINFGGSNPSLTNCLINTIGGCKEEAYAVGINSSDAQNAIIRFNKIDNIYRQDAPKDIIGEGVGILLGHDTQDCSLSQNIIVNDQFEDHTYGIWAVGKHHNIHDNVICNAQYGVYMGNSKLKNNIIMLKGPFLNSFAITGGMGKCTKNTIINYNQIYCYDLQEEVTENIPFITD